MPSVRCPRVFDWNTKESKTAWIGIMHCNACAFAVHLRLDYRAETGEVGCAAKE